MTRRLSRVALFSLLDYIPHPGQLAVHVAHARHRVMACGVRYGKTVCAAMEAVAFALEPRPHAVGWVVAPSYELASRVYREIVHAFLVHLPDHVRLYREHEHLLRVTNMAGRPSEVRAKSADSPVSLLGEGLDWVVCDEAARLKPDIWERYLSARLLDKRGRAIFISTPRGKGWFYDLYRRGQGVDSDYQSWRAPTWTNPLIAPELIEAERARLPEAVFRQEFGAEFLEGAGQVFRHVRDLATGEWSEPVAGERYVAGLDLAKVEDFTVLVIMDSRRRVVHADRFHRLDWDQQIARVKTTTDRYNHATVTVDSTGAGEPVYEALRRAGLRCSPYRFTAQSKSDLVNNLAVMLEQKKLTLPRAELWPDGIDELEAFEYSVTEQGGLKSGAPSGMHDDCAIAVMLAAWALRREPLKVEAYWA